MSNAKRLHEIVERVESLPAETQELLISEFSERIDDLAQAPLSKAQIAEVKRRLSSPRSYATEAEVRAALNKYRRGP